MWKIYMVIAVLILVLIDLLFETDAAWIGFFILVGVWIFKVCREE